MFHHTSMCYNASILASVSKQTKTRIIGFRDIPTNWLVHVVRLPKQQMWLCATYCSDTYCRDIHMHMWTNVCELVFSCLPFNVGWKWSIKVYSIFVFSRNSYPHFVFHCLNIFGSFKHILSFETSVMYFVPKLLSGRFIYSNGFCDIQLSLSTIIVEGCGRQR